MSTNRVAFALAVWYDSGGSYPGEEDTAVDARIERNRRFLSDLFAGPFRGHALIMDPEPIPAKWPGDFACSDRPLQDWVPLAVESYEAKLKRLEALDDDSVPDVRLATGTHLFAAAFGCQVHVYEDSPAAARPLVSSAEEADRLHEPGPYSPPLGRVFEYGHLLRKQVGADVPIGVPDIQSPFDIAALIWNKEDMYLALYQNPDAVQRLVAKCQRLLTAFLVEFKAQFPECNLCHCPQAWAPPELGCWLSEDEAGSMSVGMFEQFCLPSLVELSDQFGGIFVHCCATADHQYNSLKKLPNLRGLNRVFQEPGPRPAIEAFAGRAVLMQAWTTEEEIHKMLDMALPESRFLLNMPAQPLEEAKGTYERLRARCPRS